MEDGIGDGGGRPRDADLVNSPGPHGIEMIIGNIEGRVVNLFDVGVGGEQIVGQVGVRDSPQRPSMWVSS